ncbi:MAG: C39 family peptidase [Acidobacteriota bacterium]
MAGWIKLSLVPLFAGVLLAASEGGVWLDVPFVNQASLAQTKAGCGAAVISMLMQYWQAQQPDRTAPPAAEEILRALYSENAGGIYASQMDRYLAQHGFRTFAVQGTAADLRGHLEKGRPLIVALQPRGGELHYVVVAGLDWKNDVVLKNDPADRKLAKQRQQDFEREWSAAGHWMLLAVPQ